MIKPAALVPGAKVGVIAPGGFVEKSKLEAGLQTIRDLGFEPVSGENVLARRLHTAGGAEERMSDLLWSLTDPGLSGVICARGGEGASQLLPWLETADIRPRVFCGYSDITALHAWLRGRGWITFHGPLVAAELASGAFDRAGFLGEVTGERTKASFGLRSLKAGSATGTLTGGCLSLMCSLAGTRWAHPWSPGATILLLEDVDEPPYRIHRMLTQLRDSEGLRDVAGIVFGTMAGCSAKQDAGYTLDEIILDALEGFDGPIAFGLPAGHGPEPIATLPLGVDCLLTAADGAPAELQLLDTGVLESLDAFDED